MAVDVDFLIVFLQAFGYFVFGFVGIVNDEDVVWIFYKNWVWMSGVLRGFVMCWKGLCKGCEGICKGYSVLCDGFLKLLEWYLFVLGSGFGMDCFCLILFMMVKKLNQLILKEVIIR